MEALQNGLADDISVCGGPELPAHLVNHNPPLVPATYHAAPGESHSKLELFRRRRSQYAAIHVHRTMPRPEPTEAMVLGTLVDLLVLTPDDAGERFVLKPDCDRRTKAGKAEYAAFLAESVGKIIVDAETARKAEQIAGAMLSSKLCSRFFQEPGERQSIIEWTDEETGLPCRSLRDLWLPNWSSEGGVLCDLKTCRDASPRAFSSQAATLGYARQAEFYIAGHHEVFKTVPPFVFICVESVPPFPVAVYELDEDWIKKAGQQNREDMLKLAECYKTGDWRDWWGKEIRRLGAPNWTDYEGEWED